MNTNIQAMREVASWSREAKDEDTTRYFYHFSDVNAITEGRKNYVIGRKGTGKTAIAEYIRESGSHNSFSRLLSFKNFPFNILYNQGDDDFVQANQYITVWEYVIYSFICNMMAHNRKINYDAREKLLSIFDFDIEAALPNTIKKITDRGFGLNIFGFGGSVSGSSSQISDIPISAKKDSV